MSVFRLTVVVMIALAGVVAVACQTQEPESAGADLPAPPAIGDGWLTASPGDVGLDPGPLRELTERLERDEHLNVHAVLVASDGELVYEQYFAGQDQNWGTAIGRVTFNRETLHDLRSISKSVTAALVGIAQAEGLLPDVDAGLEELFPDDEIASEKAAITLDTILTMSAGLEWDETIPYSNPLNSERQLLRSQDPVRYVLDRDLVAEPGTVHNYSGGLTTLLAAMVERTSGLSIEEYARNRLFEPLGITELEWHQTFSGMHAAASGLRLRPRDLAKFGSLYLTDGEWNGTPVLPAAWVAQSTRAHIEPTGTVGYGYQWWIMRFGSGDRMMDIPVAAGLGGQRIFVVPELDLVVVINSGNYGSTDPAHDLLGERLLGEYVLAAAGLPGAALVES